MTDPAGANLRDWIGRTEVARDLATAAPFAALAATLDRPAQWPAPGTPLPAPWHWLYFLPLPRQSEIGPDGHPHRGGFLPPVPLPRRMWAGSRMVFHAPLRVGEALRRTSTIESVESKQGRSGALVFVRVRHEIGADLADAPVALTEWHDIVYREAARADDPVPVPVAAPAASPWRREWLPDPVLLFRYSALTFNGHRIHYDRDYATPAEGYPGLVVHGPLIATLLLEQLHCQRPGVELASFEFRAVRPLFDGRTLSVDAQPLDGGRGYRLWAADHEGWLAMDASVTLK